MNGVNERVQRSQWSKRKQGIVHPNKAEMFRDEKKNKESATTVPANSSISWVRNLRKLKREKLQSTELAMRVKKKMNQSKF